MSLRDKKLDRLLNSLKNSNTCTPRICVRNIPVGVTATEIKDRFKQYGNILAVTLREGAAFILFDNDDEALEAITHENGKYFLGMKMEVQDAGGIGRMQRMGGGGLHSGGPGSMGYQSSGPALQNVEHNPFRDRSPLGDRGCNSDWRERDRGCNSDWRERDLFRDRSPLGDRGCNSDWRERDRGCNSDWRERDPFRDRSPLGNRGCNSDWRERDRGCNSDWRERDPFRDRSPLGNRGCNSDWRERDRFGNLSKDKFDAGPGTIGQRRGGEGISFWLEPPTAPEELSGNTTMRDLMEQVKCLTRRIAALEAENKRLKEGRPEALASIASGTPCTASGSASTATGVTMASCSPPWQAKQSSEVAEDLTKALLEAAEFGREEEVRQLLLHGANISHADIDGWTALHYGVIGQNARVIHLLISAGAPLEARTVQHGSTPLHLAAVTGNVDLLVRTGAQIDALDLDGDSPLHAAAADGSAENVQELLRLGADRTLKNNNGKTPEDVARDPTIRALFY